MTNKIQPVKRSELSNIRMVGHNEKKYAIVIDNGTLKEWIGFGWIEIGEAKDSDYLKYPTVK